MNKEIVDNSIFVVEVHQPEMQTRLFFGVSCAHFFIQH